MIAPVPRPWHVTCVIDMVTSMGWTVNGTGPRAPGRPSLFAFTTARGLCQAERERADGGAMFVPRGTGRVGRPCSGCVDRSGERNLTRATRCARRCYGRGTGDVGADAVGTGSGNVTSDARPLYRVEHSINGKEDPTARACEKATGPISQVSGPVRIFWCNPSTVYSEIPLEAGVGRRYTESRERIPYVVGLVGLCEILMEASDG